MMDELSYNASHAADPTASRAIRAVDNPPERLQTVIHLMKQLAELTGYEVVNRIHIKDKKTGITYK